MAELEFVVSTMSIVRFPKMRSEVVKALQALADPHYQQRVWIDRVYPHPKFFDDFTLNIHTLYDDTQVLEDPYNTIGNILVSNEEAEVMSRLAKVLDSMFDRIGTELSDEEYIHSSEWHLVIERAREAVLVLGRN